MAQQEINDGDSGLVARNKINENDAELYGDLGKLKVSVNDTTPGELNSKLTIGDEFTKEIVNPAANENLLIKFKGWIYNAARSFKAIISSVNLTADRTFSWPDISGLIAIFGMTNPFSFGGQAHSGNSLEVFSASKIFDANKATIFEMDVTASTVFGIENDLPGTYVFRLKIDTASGPTISPDSSIGTKLPNSFDFDNTDGVVNIVTLVHWPSGAKDYNIIN